MHIQKQHGSKSKVEAHGLMKPVILRKGPIDKILNRNPEK